MIWFGLLLVFAITMVGLGVTLNKRAALESSVEGEALSAPGQYDSFGAYFIEAFRYVPLIRALASTKLASQFSDSHLGRTWLIIEPLVLAGIYAAVFGFGLRAGRGVDSFIVWLLVGQTFFRFSMRTVLAGSTSLSRNKSMLGTYGFPRIVFPAAEVIKAFIQFIPAFGIVLFALLVSSIWPSSTWFALPVVIFGLAGFSFGLAAILARLSFRFPDVAQLVDVIFRLLYFASFIFFPGSIFLDRGPVGELVFNLLPINPFYCFVHLARWSLMGFDNGHLTTTALSASAWFAIIFAGGSYYFYSGEHTYGPARRRAQR